MCYYRLIKGGGRMANFGIIRVQKFQIADVQGIQKHNQRQGKSKSNLDIDYERSNQNYDLLNDQNLKYESEIKEQISERVKRKPRANSVVLSEFMVTASPEYINSLSADEQKKYFERSLEFIRKRYGKENTLYAVVHHDEATPHMHVGVIPITEDNRLSAKDIFTRSELQQLQSDFPEHMKAGGFEVERGQPSDKKHLSPQEYKEKQDLEKEVQQIQQLKEKEVAELKTFKEPKKVLEKVEGSAKKAMFGDKITLPVKEFEQLKELSMSSVKAKYQLDKVKSAAIDKIADLETKFQFADQRAFKAEKQVRSLEDEVDQLKEHRRNEIIYKSMLQDVGRDLNISEVEKKGRLIMFNLENGYEPKNLQEGEEWLSILQENKKSGKIPEKRLEGFLGLLKAFLDRLLGKGQKYSLEGLKRQQETSKKVSKSKIFKNRDMER